MGKLILSCKGSDTGGRLKWRWYRFSAPPSLKLLALYRQAICSVDEICQKLTVIDQAENTSHFSFEG